MVLNNNGEIDFLAVAHILKARWKSVALCTAGGMMVAGLLAAAIPEKYEITVNVDAPYPNQLADINSGRTLLSGLKPVSPEIVHQYFLRELVADNAKQVFLENIYLPYLGKDGVDDLERSLLLRVIRSKIVTVTAPVPHKGRQLYRVRIEAPTGPLAAEWVHAFLGAVENQSRQIWAQDTAAEISLGLINTQKDIESRRMLAQKLRQDRQRQLQEGLFIAEAVGLQGPQVTAGQLPLQDKVAAYADGSQLYARGAKSLKAELTVLKAREDDAPFMDGLREAEMRLQLLQAQQVDKKFSMYRLDGAINAPEGPFYPKTLLLVMAGALLGLVIGGLQAFMRKKA